MTFPNVINAMNKIYFSHLMEDEKAIELLEKFPMAGLETIEFGIGMNLDLLSEKLYAYRKRMEPYITERPFSVHGPFLDLNPASFDGLIREATMKRFRQAYQAADELKADRIVFHSGFNPQTAFEEGWSEQAAEFWKEFLEPLDGRIRIHMENVLDYHAENLLQVLEIVDCPFFTACVDIGHANAYAKQEPEHFLTCLSGRIGHLHLHENHGEWDEHLPLGSQAMDMEKLLGLMKLHAPQASITIENSLAEDTEKSLAYLLKKKTMHR